MDLAKETAGEIVLKKPRGDKLKELREKIGLTQKEIANVLKTSRERVSRMENGHVDPTIEFVENFSKIIALAEISREMKANENLDYRGILRAANNLGILEKDLDLVLMKALSSFEEKRKDLIKDLEGE